MRGVLAFLLLTAAAHAQPMLVAEASVDQETYAYGEPITFRYIIRNVGDADTAIWGSSSCKLTFEFEGVEIERICTADENPTYVPAGTSLVAEWVFDPAEVGFPVLDGTQTITGRTSGTCGLNGNGPPCPDDLDVSATFEAPAYLGGQLILSYDVADADSVDALRAAFDAEVLSSSDSRQGRRAQRWSVTGMRIDEVVADLAARDEVLEVHANRLPSEGREEVVRVAAPPAGTGLSEPAPNPTAGRASVALRLPAAGPVLVEVVDVLGRRVAVLHDGPLAGGVEHRFTVEAGALTPGAYTIRVVGPTVRQSVPLTVAR